MILSQQAFPSYAFINFYTSHPCRFMPPPLIAMQPQFVGDRAVVVWHNRLASPEEQYPSWMQHPCEVNDPAREVGYEPKMLPVVPPENPSSKLCALQSSGKVWA
jgi:hypothetical protein